MNICKPTAFLVFCAGGLFLASDLLAEKKVVKVSNAEVLAMPLVKSLLSLSKHGSLPTQQDIDSLIKGHIMESIFWIAYAKMKHLDETEEYKKAVTHCKAGDKKLPFGIPCENAWSMLGVLANSAGVMDEAEKALKSLSDDELKKMYDAAPKSPHEAAIIERAGLKQRQESVVLDILGERFMQKMLDDARAHYDIQFEPSLRDVLLSSIQGRQSKKEQKWLADKKRMEELDKE